jgi:small subunit ribosomal protein S16
MPVRIRLQRRGKKGQPFYHVVIADGRAPRDGRFIEKIGTYNPLTHPATINLNFDRAYHWVMCGAQPSDTANMILKREGIYLKKHLMGGVQKGALTEQQAHDKLAAWKEEKSRKLSEMKLEVINSKKSTMKKRLEAETKVKEAKEAIVNEKRQAVLAEEAAKRAEAQAAAEAAAKTAEAELTAEENEQPVEEVSEVAPVEEIKEIEAAPHMEELPAGEEPVAELPAAEETETPGAE